jgi:membrane protease YdiL (CAAX protease family)
MNVRQQLAVLGLLLAALALLAFLTYLVVPFEQLAPGQPIPPVLATTPRWQLGLVEAVFILVFYGLVGLAGFWFARRLGLPGIWRAGAGWRRWLWEPMGIGLGLGVFLVAFDLFLSTVGHLPGLIHPAFPFSIVASATAGIGEEILFRSFVLGFWAFLLNLVLRHWSATRVALWVGNGIAALAFAASHLPAAMILLNAASPADLPPLVLVEGLVLNGLLGLVAGSRYMREGLVAAVGIHFWADIVWHVIFPLLTGVA